MDRKALEVLKLKGISMSVKYLVLAKGGIVEIFSIGCFKGVKNFGFFDIGEGRGWTW
jgi:hypothetical protein